VPEKVSANGGRGPELPQLTTRQIVQTVLLVFLLLVAIYVAIPRLVGLGGAIDNLGDADLLWVLMALLFSAAATGTYIVLFRSVVEGDALPLTWSETYQINLAGVAATRIFSAGGAGGIALTYWALRKAGMQRRDVARRMVAFLALQYVFYPVALIVFGILLRTGVLEGKAKVELTIIPAGVAGLMLLVGALVLLIPTDLGRRAAQFSPGHKLEAAADAIGRFASTVGEGFRFAVQLLVHPRRGGFAVLGAAGYWAANICILWASFRAFGIHIPVAVLVQGFFLGMVANLFPLAPAGVGAVDAGMIGAFVLFGIPEETVFPAILIYRLAAFWLPIPVGLVAFFQLRATVHHWEDEGLPIERKQRFEREPAAVSSTPAP
jgi:uncharacterized protein (TIRG00374 family)